MDRVFHLLSPHMAGRLGDQPFYSPPLLWDITQYLGRRIPGRDRLTFVLRTVSRYHLGYHILHPGPSL